MTIATGYSPDLPGPGRQEPLGQILKRMELVTENQIQQALEIQKKRGGVIGEILIELGFVAREEVLLALAIQMGGGIVDVQEVAPPAIRQALDALRHEPKPHDEVKFEKLDGQTAPIVLPDDLANSPPVVKLINLVLATALKAKSTELQLDAVGEKFNVRYRVEGILYDMESPPLHLAAPMIGRVMCESGMDVSERRLAQEGRVRLSCASHRFHAVVQYRSTRQGESISMHFSEELMP